MYGKGYPRKFSRSVAEYVTTSMLDNDGDTYDAQDVSRTKEGGIVPLIISDTKTPFDKIEFYIVENLGGTKGEIDRGYDYSLRIDYEDPTSIQFTPKRVLKDWIRNKINPQKILGIMNQAHNPNGLSALNWYMNTTGTSEESARESLKFYRDNGYPVPEDIDTPMTIGLNIPDSNTEEKMSIRETIFQEMQLEGNVMEISKRVESQFQKHYDTIVNAPQLTMKELIELFGGEVIETPPEPPVNIIETVRTERGKREIIELFTKRYTMDETTELPKNSVVLQLDGLLDKFLVTPYILSSEKELFPFYRSKYLNHSPMVQPFEHSSFIVLHIGDNKLTSKENALEAKQKLDVLVKLLGLGFEDGSYIAEPVPETKIEIPVTPQQISDGVLRVGGFVLDDNADQIMSLPEGSVFFSDTTDTWLGKDMGVIADGKLLLVGYDGSTAFEDLKPSTVEGMGRFVGYVDVLDSIEDVKNMRRAKTIHRAMSDKYEDMIENQLRRNPKRKRYTPYAQWGYMINPKMKHLKRFLAS